MKFLFFSLLVSAASTIFSIDKTITIDKEEAQKAFEMLRDIRNNPNNYIQELDFEQDLANVSPAQLTWNDTLAQVAEAKALDLANRNYFAHTDPDGYGINHFISESGYYLNPDWTSSKDANNFESLGAGVPTGSEAIKKLVKDSRDPLHGHRKHLLGLDEWNSNLSDIGIGFSRCDAGCKYKTYVCVIIAKHDWQNNGQ